MSRNSAESSETITVATASQDYLAWFRNERKSVGTTQNTVDAHILPAFGDRTAASLTTREIRQWHSRLALKPARKRSRIGQRTAYRELPQTDDAKRSRKASANRVLIVLKAILNRAYLSSYARRTYVAPYCADAGAIVPDANYSVADTCEVRKFSLVASCGSDVGSSASQQSGARRHRATSTTPCHSPR